MHAEMCALMILKANEIIDIPTQIKNQKLVTRHRRRSVEAAVELFLQSGFHKTTARQIACTKGVSRGPLYEFMSTKGNILLWVCDAIRQEMNAAVNEAAARTEKGTHPAVAIQDYLLVCHRLSSHIVLIYHKKGAGCIFN
jgi:AcrR family transcriptional regulator